MNAKDLAERYAKTHAIASYYVETQEKAFLAGWTAREKEIPEQPPPPPPAPLPSLREVEEHLRHCADQDGDPIWRKADPRSDLSMSLTFKDELRAAYREWNAHPSMESSLFIAEWAAAFALTKAAETCENEDVQIDIAEWQTKKNISAATAIALAKKIRALLSTLREPGKGEGT